MPKYLEAYLRELRERQIAAGGSGRVLWWHNSGINGAETSTTWTTNAAAIRDAVYNVWVTTLGYPARDLAFVMSVTHPVITGDPGAGTWGANRPAIAQAAADWAAANVNDGKNVTVVDIASVLTAQQIKDRNLYQNLSNTLYAAHLLKRTDDSDSADLQPCDIHRTSRRSCPGQRLHRDHDGNHSQTDCVEDMTREQDNIVKLSVRDWAAIIGLVIAVSGGVLSAFMHHDRLLMRVVTQQESIMRGWTRSSASLSLATSLWLVGCSELAKVSENATEIQAESQALIDHGRMVGDKEVVTRAGRIHDLASDIHGRIPHLEDKTPLAIDPMVGCGRSSVTGRSHHPLADGAGNGCPCCSWLAPAQEGSGREPRSRNAGSRQTRGCP
jgi:hypothetical protein